MIKSPQTNKACLLRFDNVSMHYSGVTVLERVCLDVYAGEFITLLGPSGSGKTTLLRLIAGFESPSEGCIYYKDQNINSLPPASRPVHTVFQNYALFPHMNVYENVAFSLRVKNIPHKTIEDRVNSALEMVKLSDFKNRHPHLLSGGQQQRVAIARAIINQPEILLLDECLSALDVRLRQSMQVELKQLQRELGITFIFITHSQEEALSMSDRVAFLNDGQIKQVGSPQEVYEEPVSLEVAKFIGEVNLFETEVSACNDDEISVVIEEKTLFLNNKKQFKRHDKVTVIVRPEDIRVSHKEDADASRDLFQGKIEEVIYKGSTVDLLVTLPSGKRLMATEFFNEDDEDLDYRIGETVWLHWIVGWEVVLGL